jgi:hypothetical protein
VKTDLFNMRKQSFAEILVDKILGSQEEESSPERDLSPAHLAFLLGKVDRLVMDGSFKTSPYSKIIRPKASRPPHPLTQSQSLAYQVFAKFKVQLSPTFSSKELKEGFRLLALKTHPDRGGDVRDFISIRNAYVELSSVFKEKSRA